MSPIKPLEIDCKLVGDARVLTLGGHITTAESQVVSENLSRLVADGTNPIVVDMTNVDIITSDGLGALIRARKASAEAGGTLALSGVKGNILDVFRMTRLDKIFPLYDSVGAAIKALQK